ncbi:MAG TPA: hypothetical protein VHR97_10530 [Candidatus Baltobacteraceae bacterium]|jgi:hypothetical protein|nr:hypothetical protein [Candidatus Baltobacteraceae bacterium]
MFLAAKQFSFREGSHVGTLALSRYALTISAVAALLAGCGGSQPPIGAPGIMAQSRAITDRAELKERSTSGALLYVISYGYSVTMLSYPGLINNGSFSPEGLATNVCSDQEGNVYVTTGGGVIYKYAHGGTAPIKTLTDPNYWPIHGCSVDPTTGDLAVANDGPSGGNVAVYAGGQGLPTYYSNSSITTYAGCAYDGSGNLFLAAFDHRNKSAGGRLIELRHGSSELAEIPLDQQIAVPDLNSIEWNDRYLAFGGTEHGQRNIYHIRISKSKGTLIGNTVAKGVRPGWWITGKTLISPFGRQKAEELGFWTYPKGGGITKKEDPFEKNSWITAVTVSP